MASKLTFCDVVVEVKVTLGLAQGTAAEQPLSRMDDHCNSDRTIGLKTRGPM